MPKSPLQENDQILQTQSLINVSDTWKSKNVAPTRTLLVPFLTFIAAGNNYGQIPFGKTMVPGIAFNSSRLFFGRETIHWPITARFLSRNLLIVYLVLVWPLSSTLDQLLSRRIFMTIFSGSFSLGLHNRRRLLKTSHYKQWVRCTKSEKLYASWKCKQM